MNDLIWGKAQKNNIVSIHVDDNMCTLYLEDSKGITKEIVNNNYWLLSPKRLGDMFRSLQGSQYYKYIAEFDNKKDWLSARSRGKQYNMYSCYQSKDAFLMRYGYSYYQGMKINDISVLSFDIETSGLIKDKTSKVYTIANAYRKNGKVERKLFSIDEFETEYEMFDAWMKWVRLKDPSLLVGHNVMGFDFPYLIYCIEKCGLSLDLGRDGHKVTVNTYPSKFRKDGSQEIEFFDMNIPGREIFDSYFCSFKFDIKREFESNGLKQIIKQLGMEKPGRTFIDASKISELWKDLNSRQKIKDYNLDDVDDSLKLFDLMAPSYFYLAQSVPMCFQNIINKASGSQLNSLMIRSYLQDNKSIPKASEVSYFEGAISWGRAGIYTNVIKWDAVSLYPSIMRSFEVYDKLKDPEGHFKILLNYFLEERLKNKRLAKETGEQYYSDMEQSQKIFANSAYGFMSAPGLHFNSPSKAAFITEKGRELLKKAIKYATNKTYEEWLNV